MKSSYPFFTCCVLMATITFCCSKARRNQAIFPNNTAPVAFAGNDTALLLSAGVIILDGSLSIDPEYNIREYLWTCISGPACSIDDASAIKTKVFDLHEGIYLFELKITDEEGLMSKDTVGVRVAAAITTEIVFTGQTWFNACYQDLPGACVINGDSPSYGISIKDTTHQLPDTAWTLLAVWVKMDTASAWERVPRNCWQFPDAYPPSDFTYCVASQTLAISSWFFSDISLAGRKADIKVGY